MSSPQIKREEASEQVNARRVGAKLGDDMSDPLFPDDEDQPGRARFSISLKAERLELVKLLAQFWNEYAELQNRKRPRKWKVSSAVERLVEESLRAVFKRMKLPEDGLSPAEFKKHLDQILVQEGGKPMKPIRP